ncbi:Uncharacterised protein [Mycobacteroides abscessus subsp. abscessus]|nr:Uncharacterised protein [Mycobacteroides abscessus subsp. abscessus]
MRPRKKPVHRIRTVLSGNPGARSPGDFSAISVDIGVVWFSFTVSSSASRLDYSCPCHRSNRG